MARPRTIRILKVLLLGLVLATLAGVAGLYVLGKKAQFSPPPRNSEGVGTDPGTEQQGSGFDHTVSRDGEPLFRMRGGRDRRDQDGNLFVEEVLVTVFRPGGERLEVVADEARYNLDEESAELRGHVSIAGTSGLTLVTEELHLKQGGRVLESSGKVDFRYGAERPLTGEAGRLRADLDRELFIFHDDVTMARGSDGYRLQANRVVIERNQDMLRATGDVRVRWGESALNADKVAATLVPGEDRLQFLRAHWNVTARIATGIADQARTTRLRGSRLGILFDGPNGAISRVEIEDEARGRARIQSEGALGSSVLWKTRYFRADFFQGTLNTVEAEGRTELVEYLTADPAFLIRRICSNRSSARFGPDGEMQQINVQREVDIQDRQFQVLATQARVTPQSLDVDGDPVHVVGTLGRITAPKVVFAESNGLVHATGGVEFEMPPNPSNPLASGPLAGGAAPIRVTSDEGFIRPSSSSFMFQGNVRAWTGPRLLRAQTLRGDADPQKITAGGGVENVWTIERETPEAGVERRQIRVHADGLTYEAAQSTAIYRGSVLLVDGSRTLRCESLTVHLNSAASVERMTCQGSVLLTAPEEERTVRADRAEYDVLEEEVIFRGRPVELTEGTGAKLQGAVLVYSTREGTVKIRGRDSEANPSEP